MHDEVVKRRKWISDDEFLDLLGATNMISGLNSTEMAIHLGYKRVGWPGLIAAGLTSILPVVLIVLGLAWAYAMLGARPQAGWLLYVVKPVVIVIIFQALWSLGRKAIKNIATRVIAAGVLGLYFLGVDEIALLFGAGLVVMLIANIERLKWREVRAWLFPFGGVTSAAALASIPFSLPILFLAFLKIVAATMCCWLFYAPTWWRATAG